MEVKKERKEEIRNREEGRQERKWKIGR